MVDKLRVRYVVTPLVRNNIPQSIQDHQDNINDLPGREASGVYCTWVIEGTNMHYLVTQLCRWLPVD